MKLYSYIAMFGDGYALRTEIVQASCEEDAEILAKAEQIKKGNRYDDLKSVRLYKPSNPLPKSE